MYSVYFIWQVVDKPSGSTLCRDLGHWIRYFVKGKQGWKMEEQTYFLDEEDVIKIIGAPTQMRVKSRIMYSFEI